MRTAADTTRTPPPVLEERTILVTGASRGVGRAISEHFLAAGAHVVGLGRHFGGWQHQPAAFTAIEMDLSDLDALTGRIAGLCREHPTPDGVICNAGSGRFGHLEQFSPTQIRQLLDLNLTQHILVARACLPLLKRHGFGDLIFIGSEAAVSGGAKGAVYSACKFGLRGLARSLRLECAASGVWVAIINPGMVLTDFFDDLDFAPGEDPENHIRPGDVADLAVAMLAAPPERDRRESHGGGAEEALQVPQDCLTAATRDSLRRSETSKDARPKTAHVSRIVCN